MMGIHEQPQAGESGKMLPLTAFGIEVVSFGTMLKPGQPVRWRGPMLAKAMREFLYEVEWGPLGYLVIDLPPGTGDIQISLAQSIPLTGAVIVTTPQDVSIADVSRGIQTFARLPRPGGRGRRRARPAADGGGPHLADGPHLPRRGRADRRRGQQGELRGHRRPPDAERAEDPDPRLRFPPAAPIPGCRLLVLFLFLVVQVRGTHGWTSFCGGWGCLLV